MRIKTKNQKLIKNHTKETQLYQGHEIFLCFIERKLIIQALLNDSPFRVQFFETSV